jgi:hypothetical protein
MPPAVSNRSDTGLRRDIAHMLDLLCTDEKWIRRREKFQESESEENSQKLQDLHKAWIQHETAKVIVKAEGYGSRRVSAEYVVYSSIILLCS